LQVLSNSGAYYSCQKIFQPKYHAATNATENLGYCWRYLGPVRVCIGLAGFVASLRRRVSNKLFDVLWSVLLSKRFGFEVRYQVTHGILAVEQLDVQVEQLGEDRLGVEP